jgi:hypothetical protein
VRCLPAALAAFTIASICAGCAGSSAPATSTAARGGKPPPASVNLPNGGAPVRGSLDNYLTAHDAVDPTKCAAGEWPGIVDSSARAAGFALRLPSLQGGADQGEGTVDCSLSRADVASGDYVTMVIGRPLKSGSQRHELHDIIASVKPETVQFREADVPGGEYTVVSTYNSKIKQAYRCYGALEGARAYVYFSVFTDTEITPSSCNEFADAAIPPLVQAASSLH